MKDTDAISAGIKDQCCRHVNLSRFLPNLLDRRQNHADSPPVSFPSNASGNDARANLSLITSRAS